MSGFVWCEGCDAMACKRSGCQARPFHVVPLGDLREHTVDSPCWCGPTEDNGVIVHHSADGREAFETGARKPS